jgi:hypothetical protein
VCGSADPGAVAGGGGLGAVPAPQEARLPVRLPRLCRRPHHHVAAARARGEGPLYSSSMSIHPFAISIFYIAGWRSGSKWNVSGLSGDLWPAGRAALFDHSCSGGPHMQCISKFTVHGRILPCVRSIMVIYARLITFVATVRAGHQPARRCAHVPAVGGAAAGA